MNKGINPIIIYLLVCFGTIGLLACFLAYGGGYFDMPTEGQMATIFFMAVFVLTLIVLVPVQILYFERKNRDKATLRKATFKDFIAMMFGVCDANVKAPWWITYPVLIVLWILVVIFVIVITGVTITHFF